MTRNALARIDTQFDHLSNALQKAARWAADHPADVCFLSLREQAKRAGVVPPTMTRLAKALGFGSFRAFQDDFRDHVAWARRSQHSTELSGRGRCTMTDDTRLALAYLSRVAEPPCPELATLVRRVGPVGAAELVSPAMSPKILPDAPRPVAG